MRIHRILRPRCPSCGKPFLLAETPFACEASAEVCTPQPDAIYASARGLIEAPRRQRVTPPPRRAEVLLQKIRAPWARSAFSAAGAVFDTLAPAGEAKCAGCGCSTRQRLCPHCHDGLPDNIETHGCFRVVLIGPPGSGKTHLLAAQSEFLERVLGRRLGMTMRPIGRTRSVALDRFRQHVFEQRRALPPTPRLSDGPDVRDPFLFELTCERLGLRVNLVLFDISGHDWMDEAALVQGARHIFSADAFLLAAPASDAADGDLIDRRTRDAFDTFLAAAARCGHAPEALAQRPLALVITKADRLAMRNELDPRLTDGVHYDGDVSAENLRMTIASSRGTIQRSDFGSLLAHVLEQRAHRVGFFAVASLGSDPDGAGRIASLNPHRVEEPLLWLFSAAGYMRAGR